MSTRLLTKKQLAERYGVKPRTIESWVRQYGLPAIRITKGFLRFDLAAVEEWESKRFKEVTA